MTKMDTLKILFQLSIERDEGGRYQVTATDSTGMTIAPDQAVFLPVFQ